MAEIDAELFERRLNRFYEFWETNPNMNSVSHIEISAGTLKNESIPFISSMFQQWLFAWEMPLTIFVFAKDFLYVIAGKKKADMFSKLNNPKLKIYEKQDKDSEEKMKILSDLSADFGTLQENHDGTWYADWQKCLQGKRLVNISTSIFDLFSSKDATEISYISRASDVASSLMVKYFQPKLEDFITSGNTITHKGFSREIQLQLERQPEEGEDPSKLLIPIADLPLTDKSFPPKVQSGNIDINLVNSNDQPLKIDFILCSIGIKYREYCGCVTRTFMVDSSKEQERNYETLEKIFKKITSSLLTVGSKLSAVYNATLAFLEHENPALIPFFGKSIGYGIGLRARDDFLIINAKNNYVIRAGNTFVISCGFQGLPKTPQRPDDKYGLWIEDTVVVLLEEGQQQSQCKVLTNKAEREYAEVSYTLEDDTRIEDEIRELDTQNILDERMRSKPQEASNEEKRKQQQQELLKRKREQQQKSTKNQDGEEQKKFSMDESLANGEIRSYQSPGELLGNKSGMLIVDDRHESVLIPLNGILIPFHVASIKNVSKSEEGEYTYLRINFKNPQTGGYVPTKIFTEAVFIKEASLRSKDPRNIQTALRLLTALKKKVSQKEKDIIEQEGLVEQQPLQLTKGVANIPRLRDVSIRPNPKGKKTNGRLEIHENGLRFTANKGEFVVDVTFQNIKHCIFQEAKEEIIVLIHFHLFNPIMIGKKKQQDVQFFTEVIEEVDQLVGKKRKNLTDREAIEEETREIALKNKLNKEFHDFSKKLEEKSQIEVEIPYHDLKFIGTPHRSAVKIMPTVTSLVSLTELPFFVVSLEDIELAYFERVSFGLKNFDLILVFKNYNRPVVSITAVPMQKLEMLKDWLTQVEIKYFEGHGSLAWPKILKIIKEDPDWDPWGENGWNDILNTEAEAEDEGQGENNNGFDDDSEDEFNPEDEEDAEEEDEDEHDDDDDDFKSDNEDEDEDEEEEDDDDDEESGKSWDELEAEAERNDRKRHHSDDEDTKIKKKRIK